MVQRKRPLETRTEPSDDESQNSLSRMPKFVVKRHKNKKAKELLMAKENLVETIVLKLPRDVFLDNLSIQAARLLVKGQSTAVRTGHIGHGVDTAFEDVECRMHTGDGQQKTVSSARAGFLPSASTIVSWV